MRLKNSQIQGIVEAFEDVFSLNNLSLKKSALYLYGSRIRDDFKGGDIDLVLRVPCGILDQVKKLNWKFCLAIQDRIGEQKVDILIMDQNPPEEPFYRIALEQAILLKEWH